MTLKIPTAETACNFLLSSICNLPRMKLPVIVTHLTSPVTFISFLQEQKPCFQHVNLLFAKCVQAQYSRSYFSKLPYLIAIKHWKKSVQLHVIRNGKYVCFHTINMNG